MYTLTGATCRLQCVHGRNIATAIAIEIQLYFFFNLGARRVCVGGSQRHTPTALPQVKRLVTHCKRGRVETSEVLTVAENLVPIGIRSTGPPSSQRAAILSALSQTKCNSYEYESCSLKYNQQDATFSLSIYFYKLLYVFQAVPPPIIRSTKLYIQRQVL